MHVFYAITCKLWKNLRTAVKTQILLVIPAGIKVGLRVWVKPADTCRKKNSNPSLKGSFRDRNIFMYVDCKHLFKIFIVCVHKLKQWIAEFLLTNFTLMSLLMKNVHYDYIFTCILYMFILKENISCSVTHFCRGRGSPSLPTAMSQLLTDLLTHPPKLIFFSNINNSLLTAM